MFTKTLAAATLLTLTAVGGASAQTGAPLPPSIDRDSLTTGSVTPPGAPGSHWNYPTDINDRFATRPVPDTVPETQQGYGSTGGPARELIPR